MVKIGARFKLLEAPPASLLTSSSAPDACPFYKELTLRGFGVQLETDGKTYEFSTEPATDDALRSRGLAFALRVVPPVPGIVLEEQIVLPNSGDAVGISWRLLGDKITPVRLIATPIFSSAEAISNEIFVFETDHDSGRLMWLPFRGASRIIADTNGRCTEPSITIDADGWENIVAPSAFVFCLGGPPALVLLSTELPTIGARGLLVGEFLANVANPRGDDRNLWKAA